MNGRHVSPQPTRRGDHARRATAQRLKLGNCIFAIPCENLYIAIKDNKGYSLRSSTCFR